MYCRLHRNEFIPVRIIISSYWYSTRLRAYLFVSKYPPYIHDTFVVLTLAFGFNCSLADLLLSFIDILYFKHLTFQVPTRLKIISND